MQFEDDYFAELAGYFTGTVPVPERVVFAEHLQRDRLDYSIASLQLVDQYLLFAYENRPRPQGWGERLKSLFAKRDSGIPKGAEWFNAVAWGGAYVGEVIRRNSPRMYHWVAFENWISEHPEQLQILGTEPALQVSALLTQANGSFTLPLNKVYKFLCAGEAESTWSYADGELRR